MNARGPGVCFQGGSRETNSTQQQEGRGTNNARLSGGSCKKKKGCGFDWSLRDGFKGPGHGGRKIRRGDDDPPEAHRQGKSIFLANLGSGTQCNSTPISPARGKPTTEVLDDQGQTSDQCPNVTSLGENRAGGRLPPTYQELSSVRWCSFPATCKRGKKSDKPWSALEQRADGKDKRATETAVRPRKPNARSRAV